VPSPGGFEQHLREIQNLVVWVSVRKFQLVTKAFMIINMRVVAGAAEFSPTGVLSVEKSVTQNVNSPSEKHAAN
jgi:hypothetical protein